jgi:cytochrome b6-f complex iron-sulfur subunit
MTAPPMTPETSSAAQPRPITRRGFLGIAWGLVLAVLSGEGAAAVWEFLRPPRPSGGFGGLVRAGRVEEFGPGSVSHVAAGQFFISRLDEGLLAMWHRCTHLGCTVPWIEAEGRFNCPCHGSIFNTRGEVLAGPAPRPMDLFAIQILDGEVWVDTGQPITRSAFDPSQVTQT